MFAHIESIGGIMGVLITQTVAGIWLLSWAVSSIKSLTNEVRNLAHQQEKHSNLMSKALERIAVIEARCAILFREEMKSDEHRF